MFVNVRKSATVMLRALVAVFALSITTWAAPASTQKIVIEFSESVSDPDRPGFVEELSDYAGVPLQYSQPLTKGSGHVFYLARPLSQQKLDKVLQRLTMRDDIYRVETYKRKQVPGTGNDARF